MPPLPPVENLPGYRESVEREVRVRAAAFLDWPEYVCSVEVRPLALEHVLRLDRIRSPFVGHAVEVDKTQAARFLWCVSPAYDLAIKTRHRLEVFPRLAQWTFNRIRHRFARTVRNKKLPLDEQVSGIVAFLEEAYMDAPSRMKNVGFQVSYYSPAADAAVFLAMEFHWPEAEILRMPVKRLFQYQRALTVIKNPRAILFNPSDKVRREALAKLMEAGNG